MKTTKMLGAVLSFIAIGCLAGNALAQTNTDNYAESFESYDVGTVVTSFVNSAWSSTESNTMVVATNYSAAYQGGAYPITDYEHNSDSNKVLWIENGVTNTIDNGFDNQTNWVDVVIKPVLSDDAPASGDIAGAVASVYFNASSNLVVMHTPSNDLATLEWVEIPDVSVSPDEWIRLTIAVNMKDGDFFLAGDNTRFYRVYVNGTVVSNAAAYPEPTRSGSGGTWFGSGADITRNTSISNVTFKGTGYIDDLVLTNALELVAPTKWTIMASAGTNGMITPAGSVEVVEGQDKTFEIDADPGYVIDNVQVVYNGVTNNMSVTSYTFTNVMAAGSIHATFMEETGGPSTAWTSATGVSDLDADRGDGMTARQAWVASVDPTDTNSMFEVTNIRHENGSNIVEWVSVYADTNLPPFGIWARTNLMDTTYMPVGSHPRTAGDPLSTPVTNVWAEDAPDYPIYYRVVATNAPSAP